MTPTIEAPETVERTTLPNSRQMRPFETLDHTETADGRKLTLHHRDGDFFIHLDGDELMSSRATGSESALADLACRNLTPHKSPRVLIGGLGFGYTLRAALSALPQRAEVTVAEVFPAVVEWNRKRLGPLYRKTLEDPRVRLRETNVWHLLGDRPLYDAILLDVDNGPSAWCLNANRRLYDRRGIDRLGRSLVQRGVLAIWSAYPDPAFARRLEKQGFRVKLEGVRGRGRKGAKHWIFLARKVG